MFSNRTGKIERKIMLSLDFYIRHRGNGHNFLSKVVMNKSGLFLYRSEVDLHFAKKKFDRKC